MNLWNHWVRGAVLGVCLGASGCLSVDDVGRRAPQADAGPNQDDAGSAPDATTPSDGDDSPTDGFDASTDGDDSPTDGLDASADGVDDPGDGLDASIDGDDSPADGDDSPVDGGPSEGDAGPPRCIDRGTYEIDGIRVRGTQNGCDDGLVCIEGACLPEPLCRPGVRSACKLPAPNVGTRSNLVAIGDDFYWIHPGTLDRLGRPERAGSLMRMTAGEWQTEKVGADVDFFDREWNELLPPLDLLLSGGFLYSPLPYSNNLRHAFVVTPDGSQQYDFDMEPASWLHCVTDGGVVIIEKVEDPSLPLEGNRIVLVARDLAAETETQLARFPYNHVSSSERVCKVHGNQVAIYSPDRTFQEQGHVEVFDLGTGTSRVLGPMGPMRGFDGESFIHLNEGSLERASIDEGPDLTSTHLRHVTRQRFGDFKVEDDFVTWARYGASIEQSVVLRASLSDVPAPQAIAEMPEVVGRNIYEIGLRMAVGARWLSYSTFSLDPTAVEVTHFVPFEPGD